jgi:hypothetical protein
MCENKIKRLNNEKGILELETYSCREVKLLRDEWLKSFRQLNCSDNFKSNFDAAFERYKEGLDEFINFCTDQPERLSEMGSKEQAIV